MEWFQDEVISALRLQGDPPKAPRDAREAASAFVIATEYDRYRNSSLFEEYSSPSAHIDARLDCFDSSLLHENDRSEGFRCETKNTVSDFLRPGMCCRLFHRLHIIMFAAQYNIDFSRLGSDHRPGKVEIMGVARGVIR
jgi:hypothetical protein